MSEELSQTRKDFSWGYFMEAYSLSILKWEVRSDNDLLLGMQPMYKSVSFPGNGYTIINTDIVVTL